LLILDTHIVSELIREVPNEAVILRQDRQIRRSVGMTPITVVKPLHGILRQTAREASHRLSTDKIGDRIASCDDAAAKVTATISAARPRPGRPGEQRDRMVAGIALVTGAWPLRAHPPFRRPAARSHRPWTA
jgi:predicted nucleic acid-binding protein